MGIRLRSTSREKEAIGRVQIDLLLTVLSLTMSRALGIPPGQAFNDVATFWNIVVSVGWIVILVYVVWKVLDNQRKLDEKQAKILERLEKILQHLGAERQPRDTDSWGDPLSVCIHRSLIEIKAVFVSVILRCPVPSMPVISLSFSSLKPTKKS